MGMKYVLCRPPKRHPSTGHLAGGFQGWFSTTDGLITAGSVNMGWAFGIPAVPVLAWCYARRISWQMSEKSSPQREMFQ